MRTATAGIPSGPARARPCPRLVAVSDEARLVRADALARVEALARARCPAILLRPGSMAIRRFYDFARWARDVCRAAAVELWIGDHADVAVAIGADAVQLPARGLSIAGARRVVGEEIRVGRSVHGASEAARAALDSADHVILGAIYATASHPTIDPARPTLVAAARAATAEHPIPILAIGGMTPERATEVITAGAWGVAALTALWDADDPAAAVSTFLDALSGDAPSRALH
ncbi:MAG: thiamine phosphate synthase [Gemmatimonadota bacterium]